MKKLIPDGARTRGAGMWTRGASRVAVWTRGASRVRSSHDLHPPATETLLDTASRLIATASSLTRPLRYNEEGSVVILVAMTLLMVIAVAGLAMDAGQLYVAKQQLQAAADAAAMGGVMDMYNGTNSTGGYGTHLAACSSTSTWTPCYYARNNGQTTDSICVDFPASQPASWPPASCATSDDSASHCAPSSGAGPCNIRVTVSRTVNTVFLGVVSQNAATVSATAVAAITVGPAAVPIVVTHPTLKDALSTSGNSSITITGGPTRTIQINSAGTSAGGTAEAFTVGGSSRIDLTGAGPSGTGGQFRSWGPIATGVSVVTTSSCLNKSVCVGASGGYSQPASIIEDPFANLAQPSVPATAGTVTTVQAGNSTTGITGCAMGGVAGQFTCTAGAVGGSCQIYRPGKYTSGIKVQSNTAYFSPGVYYITTADSGHNAIGFQSGSNSDMEMLSSLTGCSGVIDSTSTDFSNGGMVVFNGGDGTFNVGSNGTVNLVGPNTGTSTSYEGILFWEDRTLTPASFLTHSFGGGGNMQLTGTIYTNMQSSHVTNSTYHLVQVSGNSGSTTQILGEVISNAISLQGSGAITMTLNSALVQRVRQVALVQ